MIAAPRLPVKAVLLSADADKARNHALQWGWKRAPNGDMQMPNGDRAVLITMPRRLLGLEKGTRIYRASGYYDFPPEMQEQIKVTIKTYGLVLCSPMNQS